MFRIKNVHSSSLGGIIKVKHDIIFDINGFPNNIWGWGIEDRALYYRYKILDFNISTNKFNDNLPEIYCIPHQKVWETYVGEKKEISDLENAVFNESKKIKHSQLGWLTLKEWYKLPEWHFKHCYSKKESIDKYIISRRKKRT